MSQNKSGLWIKIFLFFGLFLVILSLIIMLTMTPSPKTKASNSTQISIVNNNSAIGGDFILTDVYGNRFDSRELYGKNLLIYFGFTFCPDICPASLYEMSQALNQIKDTSRVQALFITLDPNRDTPQQLKEYFNDFDKRIIPLTGTEKEIDQVAKKFRVYYSKEYNKLEKHYLINHSSFFYLVDINGKLIKYYPSGVGGIEMGRDIARYL
jgi:protein SCO1